MAVNCGPSFGLCGLRVTVLDDLGNVAAGSNSYVTDGQISLAFTPNIDTGATFSQRNGCGCSLAKFKAEDIFNWWEFTFTDGLIEDGLVAIMTGSTPITVGGSIVGVHYPEALTCDETQPIVALEAWTRHLIRGGSGLDSQYPYIHWVWPASKWTFGDNTAEEDFMNPVLTGFSISNPLWGGGPYGDGPPDGSDVGAEGSRWKTAEVPPTASCALASVTPGS
jgi:hypothetical protein